MEYQSVSITYTRKLNLGSYESVDATCYLSAKIEEKDKLGDVLASLRDTAKQAVYKALESEMSNEVKVILKGKICGKELDGKETITTVTNNKSSGSSNSNGNGNKNKAVISKFAHLMDTGEETLEYDCSDEVPF